MKKSDTTDQEAIGKQLFEYISQIQYDALGEGAAVCVVCRKELRKGDPVVVFAFRPVDHSTFEISHVKCTECRHEPTEYFTLGVCEVVLDGRVGTCSDQATQSSWPVLLAPRPRAVSSAETTTVEPLLGVTWFRRPVERSDVFAVADCESGRKPWQRPVVRADDAGCGGASELGVGLVGDDVPGAVVRRSPDDAGLGGGR